MSLSEEIVLVLLQISISELLNQVYTFSFFLPELAKKVADHQILEHEKYPFYYIIFTFFGT